MRLDGVWPHIHSSMSSSCLCSSLGMGTFYGTQYQTNPIITIHFVVQLFVAPSPLQSHEKLPLKPFLLFLLIFARFFVELFIVPWMCCCSRFHESRRELMWEQWEWEFMCLVGGDGGDQMGSKSKAVICLMGNFHTHSLLLFLMRINTLPLPLFTLALVSPCTHNTFSLPPQNAFISCYSSIHLQINIDEEE